MQALLKTHATLLATGIASFVLMGAGQSLYGPALPAFARNLGLSLADAGWLVSAHWIGCFLGVACMYRWGKRISPREVLAMMAAGAGLIASTPGLWGTMAGAVIFGAGYGCATVVFNPRVLAAFGDKGASMLSLLNAVFSLGAIAAPFVFLALGSSPALTFGVVAVGCAVICVLAGTGSKTDVVQSTGPVPFKVNWGILTFGMVAIGMEACLIGLGPTALIQTGKSETAAAELLSLFFVAFLIARVALVFAAQYIPSFTLHTLALAGAALAALYGALGDPGTAFVLIGVTAGLFFPSFFVTAARKMGTDVRVPPTIIAAGLVGGILSPVLMTKVMANFGDRGFFWIIAVIAGLMSAAALLSLRSMNR
jgi:MFS transporter, FHS family, glucose/mannose:H+ symporter